MLGSDNNIIKLLSRALQRDVTQEDHAGQLFIAQVLIKINPQTVEGLSPWFSITSLCVKALKCGVSCAFSPLLSLVRQLPGRKGTSPGDRLVVCRAGQS